MLTLWKIIMDTGLKNLAKTALAQCTSPIWRMHHWWQFPLYTMLRARPFLWRITGIEWQRQGIRMKQRTPNTAAEPYLLSISFMYHSTSGGKIKGEKLEHIYTSLVCYMNIFFLCETESRIPQASWKRVEKGEARRAEQ